MLLFTAALILIQLVIAVAMPVRFVYFALWLQTIPYTWNFDTQVVFDTPFGPLNVVAMQLFGFALCCAVIVATHFERASAYFNRYRWHALFLVFCIAALVYAPSIAYGLRMLAKLSTPLLFMIVVLAMINSEEELRKAQTAIFGSGVVLLGLALIARAAGIEADPNVLVTGVSGLGPPGMGPPVFSAHMLPVAMLALATFLKRPKTLTLLMVVAFSLGILAALQRTSAGALYIGFSLILFFGTRGIWRLLFPTIALLGLPALLIFSPTFRQRMFFDATSSDALLADPSKALGKVNGSGRFDLWDSMLNRFFRPHPFFGNGIGSTQDFLYEQSGAGVVHSEYVRLLCEMGLLGLGLFILAFLAYILQLGALIAQGNNSPARGPALAAIGAVSTYLLFCSTDNAFDYVAQFGIYVFGLIALSIKSSELGPAMKRETSLLPQAQAPLFPNLMR